ncbi:hypothetical protein H4R33_006905, partial [Dimargaris cristalligena]
METCHFSSLPRRLLTVFLCCPVLFFLLLHVTTLTLQEIHNVAEAHDSLRMQRRNPEPLSAIGKVEAAVRHTAGRNTDSTAPLGVSP